MHINKKITIEIAPTNVFQSSDMVRLSATWTEGGVKQTLTSIFHAEIPIAAYLPVIEKMIKLAMEGDE